MKLGVAGKGVEVKYAGITLFCSGIVAIAVILPFSCVCLTEQAFTQLYLVRVFADAVQSLHGSLREVMETLWRLFVVDNILASLGNFLLVGQ